MVARILVLEDDRALALDLERDLSPFGCEIVVIGDGSVGLARAVAERVDLVLVSAELRGTNGFRVCNRLKKYGSGPRIPVIITWTEASASAREEHARLATAADAYIRKPFGPSELRGQVRAHVPMLAKHDTLHGIPAVRVPIASIEPPRRPHSGVVPSPFSQAPTESPASMARLDRELATAVADQTAIDGLRARLTELEAENARLVHDLNATRARASAAAKPPPPVPPRPPHAGRERELTAIRDAVAKKDAEIVALKRDLELARHAVEAASRPLTAPPPDSAKRRGSLTSELETAEKTLATLRGEKDLATKRSEHLQRSVDSMKADLEKVRAELAEQKKTRATESGRHAQALTKHKAEVDAARRAGEAAAHAQLTNDLDARVVRVAEELAAAHAAKLVEIKAEADRHAEELADTIAQLARERAELTGARSAEHEAKLAETLLVQTELQASTRALGTKLREAEAARDAQAAELEALRVAHRADVSAVEARLSEATASLAASESALSDATAARKNLEAEASSLRAGRAKAEKDLREATIAADRSEKRANDLEWDLAASQARPNDSEGSEEQRRAVEETHARRVSELEAAIADAKAAKGEAEAAATAHKAELETVRATLDERARDLAEARRGKESVNRTVVAQHASLEKLRAAQKSVEAARNDAELRARAAAAALAEARAAFGRDQASAEGNGVEEERARAEAAERDLAATRATLAEVQAQAADLEEQRGRLLARAASAERGRAAAEATLDIQTRSARSAREAAAAQFERELRRAAEAHAVAEQSIREEAARADEALRASHAQELARIREEVGGASAADIAAAEARFEERLADLTKQLGEATTREGQARADLHAEIELREKAERRVQDLEPLLARTRESLDLERRDRLREEGETAVRLETLEEQVAARDADLVTATRETSELRDEVVALEGEIAAMRTELAGARTRVENESAMARAATEELEKNRKLITRARALLAELVDGKEKTGKA